MRETLSRQVGVARPLTADPAGQAIRRGNRIRRRRTVVGLSLAAITTVVVSTGMAQLAQDPDRQGSSIVVIGDPDPSVRAIPTATVPAPPPSPGAPADLLVGGTLISADGKRLELPGVGPAERARPLPGGGGLLVVGAATTAGRSLWVAQSDGLVQVLLAGAGQIVLAPDGRQVAWRDGTDLLVAGVIGTQLIGSARTPVPAGAEPVRFVGDSVLVRLDPAAPGHALWRPGAGQLVARGDRSTINVYGTLPDGRLIGQVATDDPRRTCLAVLGPTPALKPDRTGCGLQLSRDGVGGVSTDGRWLLVNGSVGKVSRSLLVDLSQLGPDTAAVPAGPPMTGTVAWTTTSQASYLDGTGQLVRVDVDRVRAGTPATPAPVNGVQPGDRPVLVTGS
ncbi:hypothetical protein F8271_23630 [Micromonospora sp. ALFpr18c]|uniref:hypothetical protein n=1 Tax=Micromonospora sp. ALFpr18c TaxID=1458665 RepID=UPI00124B508D|nr:hypothetical protein [Micromonospora sp. ALFpr18c]KAB1934363.1 hypothetical protein F8271_23630 [Micromonospora sp. ALFpr18c]